MNKVSREPRLPQVTERPFLPRLLDVLREFATSINQAAEGNLHSFVTVTGAYTATKNDLVILVAPTAPCTITLASALDTMNKRIVVKRSNNTTHTITVAGTIDGGSSVTLTTAYQAREFFSNGSQYYLL